MAYFAQMAHIRHVTSGVCLFIQKSNKRKEKSLLSNQILQYTKSLKKGMKANCHNCTLISCLVSTVFCSMMVNKSHSHPGQKVSESSPFDFWCSHEAVISSLDTGAISSTVIGERYNEQMNK